jgi:hypothetical protein
MKIKILKAKTTGVILKEEIANKITAQPGKTETDATINS